MRPPMTRGPGCLTSQVPNLDFSPMTGRHGCDQWPACHHKKEKKTAESTQSASDTETKCAASYPADGIEQERR